MMMIDIGKNLHRRRCELDKIRSTDPVQEETPVSTMADNLSPTLKPNWSQLNELSNDDVLFFSNHWSETATQSQSVAEIRQVGQEVMHKKRTGNSTWTDEFVVPPCIVHVHSVVMFFEKNRGQEIEMR